MIPKRMHLCVTIGCLIGDVFVHARLENAVFGMLLAHLLVFLGWFPLFCYCLWKELKKL